MPKRQGTRTNPSEIDLPGTLKRSPAKAQRTYRKTLASAHRTYDDERAHRAAFASVKHAFQKVGDHWEPKMRKGPSDPQARTGGPAARDGRTRTAGGVDVEGSSRAALYERARRLGVPGRSGMSKLELARAIARKQG